METDNILDGHELKAMFTAGADWLEKIVPDINALNVYPVPDGDCGTNLLLTIRTSLQEASSAEDGSAGAFVSAIARGALMGARGNSGVILSQIWRGLAQALADKKTIDHKDLALALQKASEMAYLALSHPVEGTILTVIRDAAEAASREAEKDSAGSTSVMAAAVSAARKSVLNTPNLLSVLKDAGVVDAGGHGLHTFLEGALHYLKNDFDGHSPELLCNRTPLVVIQVDLPGGDDSFGFCTQFMIRGAGLNVAVIRKALESLGNSMIVVGDDTTVRVHIHTYEPKEVTLHASKFGQLFDIDIRNMDEQHQDFLLMNRGKTEVLENAVVAVVNGDGMVNVFADLGVTTIVPGGQTMNPSTTEILRTLEEVPCQNIILLPNNKNVVPAALLAQSMSKKNVRVIPTESIPQGISALVAFVPEADFETNITQMSEAMATVKTIEVTRATRPAHSNHLSVQAGQFIGLLDGELLTAGDTPEAVIVPLLERVDASRFQIVTLYFGQNTVETEAEQMGTLIRERYPDIEVGVVKAGQPSYNYIISVE